MKNKQAILQKRFDKLEKHYLAPRDYKKMIDDLSKETNIYDQYSIEKEQVIDSLDHWIEI